MLKQLPLRGKTWKVTQGAEQGSSAIYIAAGITEGFMEEVAFKRAFKKSMGFSHKENPQSQCQQRVKRQKARIMHRTELTILKRRVRTSLDMEFRTKYRKTEADSINLATLV